MRSNSPSIETSMVQLATIIKPGKYSGNSVIDKTDQYPDGINAVHTLTIKMENNMILAENKIDAFNLKTNKKLYSGVRMIKFFQKPNHGNNIFRSSESYINDQLVSSVHGYLSNMTNNSVTFNLSGSWHVHSSDYKHIELTITNINDNMLANFSHYNILNMSDFTMTEEYIKI